MYTYIYVYIMPYVNMIGRTHACASCVRVMCVLDS